MEKKSHKYGGQAVIEGVMMKSNENLAVAVRLENGKIKKKHQKLSRSRLYNLFFIRGIYGLYDMMKLGMSALNWSAEQQMDEDEDASVGSSILNSIILTGVTIISILFALFLFKVVPYFLSSYIVGKDNLILFNLMDGLTKLFLLILYMWGLLIFKETRKIFEYHGAEHKVIGCYESGNDLTPENCMKYSKEHKRCGTNFLFFVVFVSIVVYLFIPLSLPWYWNIVLRIAFLPIIAGISYEILRFNDSHENGFTNILSIPGMMMQKLTTREPNKSQLEVAIESLKEVIKQDNK